MQCRMVELRCKEVINICDGCRIGYVGDVEVILPEGKVAGGRAGGAGALPVLRAVRTGRGILHPLGVHQADRGRHHSRRQARSAQAALQAPPAQRGFLSRAAENRTVK